MEGTTMTKEERITHWRAVVRKHATNGLSAAAFCREQDLNIHQFRWWQRRFRKENSRSESDSEVIRIPFFRAEV